MLRFNDTDRCLDLGVHDLIEAGPPSGNLVMQVAWTARARMRAGQRVHTDWQAERAEEDAHFEREVSIRHKLVVRDWEVTISGRIDGLSNEGGFAVVEEVKSTALPAHRLDGATWSDFPAWSKQVQLYLWFMQGRGWPTAGRLVLVSLVDGTRRVIAVPPDPHLADWVVAQLDWVLHRHELKRAWQARRAASPVPFAHADWRPGQQVLAIELEAALHAGKTALLCAPTGYGKTAASLHAALRVASATGRRVFFATARTTQQRMAEEAVQPAAGGLPVRAVSIRAKEKICQNEVVACRPDACSFADAYFDKVRDGGLLDRLWKEAGGGLGATTPDEVVAIGQGATACPFALTMDLVGEADVVIGDLNYVFDPSVRLSEVHDALSEWIVIVDEAHNLPDRATSYGSPELRLFEIERGIDALADSPSAARYRPCKEALQDLAALLDAGLARIPDDAKDGEAAFSVEEGIDARAIAELAERFEALALEYSLMRAEVPCFAPGEPDPWMDAARGVYRLRAALDRAGEESVLLRRGPSPWRRGPSRPSRDRQVSFFGQASPPRGPSHPEAGLKLLCRDPSKLLGPIFEGLGAAVCMSATLAPSAFYEAMLGLHPDRLARLDHDSPFPPENRRVVLLPEVSTEYRRRDRDRVRTAELVSQAVAAVPGNVAVFFPSFAFLEQLEPLLALSDRPVLVQRRSMKEAERAALLSAMGDGAGHVLLAVLGGIFAEGVDLPGAALLGAVVVGPALPQANLERRLLQEWFEARYQQGFRYAWLVPGMNRVIQAAGRVIRTPEDRGAIVLIGRRFLLKDYQAFFPSDWAPIRARSPEDALHGLWP